MIRSILAVSACALALASSALAQDGTNDDDRRFIFKPVQDGFVRLDTHSGQVALCSRHAVGFACEAAPEERVALEAEIARLQGENAVLKKALLTHGLDLPAGVKPEPPSPRGDGRSRPDLRLPSDADLDRVMAFLGRVWHRLVALMARLQHQS